jgi:inositol-phosphate transport system substrate-binding protein
MLNKKMFVLAVLLLGLFLAACGGTETVEVTRVVEVPGEEVEVEVTVVVEVAGETITEEVEVTRVVEVEVPVGGELVSIVARCKANPPTEDGRCNNLVSAVGAANAALFEAGDARRIELEIIQDNADWGDYKTEFELASDAGQAPDIIVSGHEDIGNWATSGIIIDLTDMIGDYPEFEDVIPALWTSTELNGRRWGAPQDAEARPLYYSKTLLAELGWSQEEIDSLPDRIASAEFTWDDMLDTAAEAVEAGVVDAGNGWWHRVSNGGDFLYYYTSAGGELMGEGDALVFDQEAALSVYQMLEDATQVRDILSTTRLDGDWTGWHTGVSGGDVLFWYGGSWNWADWAANYVSDQGGEDFLWDTIGFAAIPAWITGEPTTLTHPLLYMVSSQAENPDLAMLLISKATTKELNTDYAIASGHLGILESQAEYTPYTSAKFLSAVLPLLEYTTFLPNSPFWSRWSEAYYLGILAVESGDLTADEALEVVVDQLQNELGDNVVIQ